MKWINSTGGPLVLMEKRVINHWGGVLQTGDEPSDYDRACSVDEYIGKIISSNVPVLVINQEPMFTTWISKNGSEGIIVRCFWARDLREIDRYFDEIISLQGWCSTETVIEFLTSDLAIFDSSESGSRLSDFIELELSPGMYAVATLLYEPNTETKLILHRLTKS